MIIFRTKKSQLRSMTETCFVQCAEPLSIYSSFLLSLIGLIYWFDSWSYPNDLSKSTIMFFFHIFSCFLLNDCRNQSSIVFYSLICMSVKLIRIQEKTRLNPQVIYYQYSRWPTSSSKYCQVVWHHLNHLWIVYCNRLRRNSMESPLVYSLMNVYFHSWKCWRVLRLQKTFEKCIESQRLISKLIGSWYGSCTFEDVSNIIKHGIHTNYKK